LTKGGVEPLVLGLVKRVAQRKRWEKKKEVFHERKKKRLDFWGDTAEIVTKGRLETPGIKTEPEHHQRLQEGKRDA